MRFYSFLLSLGLLFLGPQRASALISSTLPERPEAQTATETQSRGFVMGFLDDATVEVGEAGSGLLALGANALVDGSVRGPIVVIGGDLNLNGEANDCICIVGGSVHLGAGANAKGHITVIGGTLTRTAGARIDMDPVVLGSGFAKVMEPLRFWMRQGLFWGRPVVPSQPLVWWILGVFFVFYCLIAIVFRKATGAPVEALELHPVGALFTGFLVSALLLIIAGILVLTLAGWVLLPFFLLGGLRFRARWQSGGLRDDWLPDFEPITPAAMGFAVGVGSGNGGMRGAGNDSSRRTCCLGHGWDFWTGSDYFGVFDMDQAPSICGLCAYHHAVSTATDVRTGGGHALRTTLGSGTAGHPNGFMVV